MVATLHPTPATRGPAESPKAGSRAQSASPAAGPVTSHPQHGGDVRGQLAGPKQSEHKHPLA